MTNLLQWVKLYTTVKNHTFPTYNDRSSNGIFI